MDVGCMVFFFFQAEDGIRDVAVTGVQTCALPILFSEGLQLRNRTGSMRQQTKEYPARGKDSGGVGGLHGKRSEEHTSELQSRLHLVCRLLLEKKKKNKHHRE